MPSRKRLPLSAPSPQPPARRAPDAHPVLKASCSPTPSYPTEHPAHGGPKPFNCLPGHKLTSNSLPWDVRPFVSPPSLPLHLPPATPSLLGAFLTGGSRSHWGHTGEVQGGHAAAAGLFRPSPVPADTQALLHRAQRPPPHARGVSGSS